MNADEYGHPDAEGAKDSQRTQKEQPIENDCSHAIIGAAVEVQRVLGVGLLESAYSAALAIELAERELGFQRVSRSPAPTRAEMSGSFTERISSWKARSSWKSRRSTQLQKSIVPNCFLISVCQG